jgi:hypothetical protein
METQARASAIRRARITIMNVPIRIVGPVIIPRLCALALAPTACQVVTISRSLRLVWRDRKRESADHINEQLHESSDNGCAVQNAQVGGIIMRIRTEKGRGNRERCDCDDHRSNSEANTPQESPHDIECRSSRRQGSSRPERCPAVGPQRPGRPAPVYPSPIDRDSRLCDKTLMTRSFPERITGVLKTSLTLRVRVESGREQYRPRFEPSPKRTSFPGGALSKSRSHCKILVGCVTIVIV